VAMAKGATAKADLDSDATDGGVLVLRGCGRVRPAVGLCLRTASRASDCGAQPMNASTIYRSVSLDGRCVMCRVEGCTGRVVALRRLGQHQLPQRRPGATRPDRLFVRRVA
jgi:hypothetical protein